MEGTIHKMEVKYGEPVLYKLPIGSDYWEANAFLGKRIQIVFRNEIHCIHCGKSIKKSFGQGYCYPCFITVPETSDCVLKPELCQAHLGISRDMNWSQAHCLQDHFVYLALTSDVKVGVTRASQIPVRWIDQGAWKAIKIACTPNRYWAGVIEVELKKHLTDKTNWRHMLTNVCAHHIDLLQAAGKALDYLPESMRIYALEKEEAIEIQYPVLRYPQKINSVTLDKQPVIEGILQGIRGQYLIFDNNQAINIRSHQGYRIEIQT